MLPPNTQNTPCIGYIVRKQASDESRDSSVGIALGYGLDDRGSRVRFPEGAGNFLFTTASRTALGPTRPPIQWVPGALSLGVKRPGREADQSSPSSAEVEELVELYLHSPNTPSWRGAQLKKHRDPGAHPASYPMGTGGSFPGSAVARALS
jgi:hypothetical protein